MMTAEQFWLQWRKGNNKSVATKCLSEISCEFAESYAAAQLAEKPIGCPSCGCAFTVQRYHRGKRGLAALTKTLAEIEREAIRQRLERFNHDVALTAKSLGVSRNKIYLFLQIECARKQSGNNYLG